MKAITSTIQVCFMAINVRITQYLKNVIYDYYLLPFNRVVPTVDRHMGKHGRAASRLLNSKWRWRHRAKTTLQLEIKIRRGPS
jgi:hypothetical protein